MNILIVSPKVTEWEEIIFQCFSLKEKDNADSFETVKTKLSDAGFNVAYIGPQPTDMTIEEYAQSLLVADAKDLTKQIIAGNKILPSLEELKSSSRIVCAVLHSRGKKLYICVPVHHYHAWSLLEDNNKTDDEKLMMSIWNNGSLFIRLATEIELNEKFVTFQKFGGVPMLASYQPILAEKLKDSIYAH